MQSAHTAHDAANIDKSDKHDLQGKLVDKVDEHKSQ